MEPRFKRFDLPALSSDAAVVFSVKSSDRGHPEDGEFFATLQKRLERGVGVYFGSRFQLPRIPRNRETSQSGIDDNWAKESAGASGWDRLPAVQQTSIAQSVIGSGAPGPSDPKSPSSLVLKAVVCATDRERDFELRALNRHNYYRARHGVPPLNWCSKV